MSWMKQAACRGLDTSMFYFERGHSTDTSPIIAICKSCPVQTECLEYAIENCERFGIWGGLSVRQRRQIRYQRGLGPCEQHRVV